MQPNAEFSPKISLSTPQFREPIFYSRAAPHDISLAHYKLNRMLNRALNFLSKKGTILIEGLDVNQVYVDRLVERLSVDPKFQIQVISKSHQSGQSGHGSVIRIDRVD